MTDLMITKIDTLLAEKEKVVVAIEGMCAAGKSSLAKELKQKFNGTIIPMDAFFLPKKLRTEDRYQEVGGNIHYERFMQEIMYPILNNKLIKYRIFNCKEMEYSTYKEVAKTSLYIIEGTYCMRNEFRKIYDLSIFLSCSALEQKRRILERNGEENFKIFQDKWIPLENEYFEKNEIKKCCNMTEYTGGKK